MALLGFKHTLPSKKQTVTYFALDSETPFDSRRRRYKTAKDQIQVTNKTDQEDITLRVGTHDGTYKSKQLVAWTSCRDWFQCARLTQRYSFGVISE